MSPLIPNQVQAIPSMAAKIQLLDAIMLTRLQRFAHQCPDQIEERTNLKLRVFINYNDTSGNIDSKFKPNHKAIKEDHCSLIPTA